MCSHFWEVTETCGAPCCVHYTSLRASASPFGNFEHFDGIDFRCRACACGGAAMSGRSSRPASLNMLIRWPRFSYDPPQPNPSHSAVRPDAIARLLHGATGARAVPCGPMLEQYWRTRVAADVVVLRSKPPIRSSGKRCGAPEGACCDPVAYREQSETTTLR